MAWLRFGSGSGGSTTATELSQTTKLGIVASTTAPEIFTVTISSTTDFKRPPLEVLKFVAGTVDVVSTETTFSNAESTNFNADAQVVFDGVMKLKTSYSNAMTDNGALGAGQLFSYTIDRTVFKAIEKVEVV